MEQFFKTPFGREIKHSLETTKKHRHGQSIYRVKEKIPKYDLKKGDLLYLDNLHKDHLEVFDKRNKLKTVLNLDGTISKKVYRAFGRKL